MHQLASGHDSQFSCPVGIIGFGLGATDQPRTDATAGTDALAGAAAGPATAMAATSTGTIAATRLNFPARPAFCAARTAEASRLVHTFMVTPMLESSADGNAGPGGADADRIARQTSAPPIVRYPGRLEFDDPVGGVVHLADSQAEPVPEEPGMAA